MDLTLPQKDFLILTDFSTDQLNSLIALGRDIKSTPKKYSAVLKGKTLGMLFAKNSTRTRISFEVGVRQLGGWGLFMGPSDMQLSRGETISDTGQVLSRYLDGIMFRTYEYQQMLDLAQSAQIPVINGLTDFNHPCQALADMMTLEEKFGNLEGLKLAYVGDGNNMALSLLFACVRLGLHFSAASPAKYTLDSKAVDEVRAEAEEKNLNICLSENIEEAGADVVYTDVWASMGQEEERQQRLHDLADYIVDEQVMSFAQPKALFMHCLPAHRGEEVSATVIDGQASIVLDQAENRLHLQKAIMATLMK